MAKAITLRAAVFPADEPVVRRLWEGYGEQITEMGYYDLGGETLQNELQKVAEFYLPGEGAILIAEENGEPLGTIALRKLAGGDAELRRLFVLRHARGRGIARKLMEDAIAIGKDHGYLTLKLDTFRAEEGPQALYRSLGFTECDAFNDYPADRAMWFEKKI